MTARMDIAAVEPEAYQAMIGLGKHFNRFDLPKSLVFLVQLRASQINGCAFCVDKHSAELKSLGESDPRLYGVAVWQETPFFTEQERAALALTESITRLSEGGDRVPDEVWDKAAKHFTEQQLAQLVIVIASINAWNRLAVPTRKVPLSYQG